MTNVVFWGGVADGREQSYAAKPCELYRITITWAYCLGPGKKWPRNKNGWYWPTMKYVFSHCDVYGNMIFEPKPNAQTN